MVELHRQNLKENTKKYYAVKKILKKKFPDNTQIDHVGSTAIPYMYGKNIIDILVGVPKENEMDKYSEIIKNLGYFPGRDASGIYRFFASRNEETESGDIHIHLVYVNTQRYKDFLILKKYLLNNKEERRNYSNIKKKIIKDGYCIRSDYKSIKSEYVTSLLERARKSSNI